MCILQGTGRLKCFQVSKEFMLNYPVSGTNGSEGKQQRLCLRLSAVYASIITRDLFCLTLHVEGNCKLQRLLHLTATALQMKSILKQNKTTLMAMIHKKKCLRHGTKVKKINLSLPCRVASKYQNTTAFRTEGWRRHKGKDLQLQICNYISQRGIDSRCREELKLHRVKRHHTDLQGFIHFFSNGITDEGISWPRKTR